MYTVKPQAIAFFDAWAAPPGKTFREFAYNIVCKSVEEVEFCRDLLINVCHKEASDSATPGNWARNLNNFHVMYVRYSRNTNSEAKVSCSQVSRSDRDMKFEDVFYSPSSNHGYDEEYPSMNPTGSTIEISSDEEPIIKHSKLKANVIQGFS